ncbi:IS1595 family transposase [Terrarubrum flagellatum]|uniref:IS1595 family transposase n=1 Tax=Terrirubrum flagellatum TaxID=2895980 RepID=UPI0031454291
MSVDLTDPIFTDEEAARKHFEALRWPNGPVCPHCEAVDQATEMKGKTTRPGLYKCRACAKPFTATIGTVYERSHIPLHKWLLATHLLCSSKKGMSAHQLFRMLGFGSYRTAWFMAHRIREAMKPVGDAPLGSGGGIVEADETYIGRKKGVEKKGGGFGHKMKVMSLVERGGNVRSVVMDKVTRKEVERVISENVAKEAHLRTDTAQYYIKGGFGTASHEMVNHYAGEYVRGDAHTNTLEGFYSVFKRGMKGVYQHCGEQHLHRYAVEFDFRYNTRTATGHNDTDRATKAIKGVAGKRLTYRQPDSADLH